jgi:hypothetical protein
MPSVNGFVETIETRVAKQSWGAEWRMALEKWVSKTGKTVRYVIYHTGGQSYPVGTYRSLKAAYKDLNSFATYQKVI